MTNDTKNAGVMQMKHLQSRCPAAEFSYVLVCRSFIRIFVQMEENQTIKSEEGKHAQVKQKHVETCKGKSLHSQPPFYQCFVYYTNVGEAEVMAHLLRNYSAPSGILR